MSQLTLYRSTILMGIVSLAVMSASTDGRLLAQSKEDAKAKQRKKHLEQMRSFVDVVKVYKVTSKGSVRAELVQKPLLFFTDSARDVQNGSLWVWGLTGRPSAIIEVYTSSNIESWPKNVMHSLSSGPLKATAKYGWRWSPRKPGFTPQRFAKASPPGTRKVIRLRQMKELARRFTSHEYWDPDNQRSELRLLTQPVYRYSDAASGLLDGALFAFSHGGTNPEAILLIEARGQDVDRAVWQFGFVRLGHAELHAELDGREVWKQPRLRAFPPSDHSYFMVTR